MDASPIVQSGASWRPESAGRGSEYAMLSRQVRQAGLLDRRLRYYAWKITLTALALAAGWAAFAVLGNSWWQLGIAVFLAVAFAQVGFLGHDAGHRQVFRTRRANDVLGVLCGNLATGLSYGWWTGKHNRHHAHPNTEGADPDIMISVLAFSGSQARASRGIQRLAFPLPGLAAGPHAVPRGDRPARCQHPGDDAPAVRPEPGLGGGAARHPCRRLPHRVFLVLPPVKAVAFIVVQQGVFGFYLGCSFAPNHKGMPVLAASDKTDFLRRQVLTSRNVRGGWLTDFALGRPELPDRAPPVPVNAAS